MVYKITDSEVSEVLEAFEYKELVSVGLKNISGGFSKATIHNQDATHFDIELRYGVCSDVEHRITTENYKMCRDTLEITEA